MLKKENITAIETLLQLEAGTLQGALDNKDEVEITIPEIVAMKKADFDLRLKNEKDQEYKKGKTAGEEMLIKEAREKHGLTFEGKTIDNLMDAFQKKVVEDNKIQPDERLKEKDKTIKQLRDNLTKIEQDKLSLQSQFENEKKTIQVQHAIFSAIPDNAITTTIGRNDILALFTANGYSVDVKEGKHVVSKNGEELKNPTTLVPMELKDVVNQFVTEKGLITSTAGRGAGDEGGASGGAKPGTIEAFDKEMTDKGIKYGEDAYFKEMDSRIKQGTLKV